MAELNHDTIKSQIVTILKADAALYTTTNESGELRSIETGKNEDILQDAMFPYAIITNGKPVDTISDETFILADAVKLIEHTLRYRIIVVVNEQDSRKAESELDNYTELIMETLEADRDLSGNVDTHDISSVGDLDDILQPTGGKRGRVINMTAIKTTTGG